MEDYKVTFYDRYRVKHTTTESGYSEESIFELLDYIYPNNQIISIRKVNNRLNSTKKLV